MNTSLTNYFRAITEPFHAFHIASDVTAGRFRACCLIMLLEDGILRWRWIETNRHLIGPDGRGAAPKSD